MAYYLFNGIKLPDINTVWTDTETDPFAFIVYRENVTVGYVLILSPSLPTITDGKHSAWVPYYVVENNAWVSGGTGMVTGSPVWSNHDIYTTDGTLYLAATDPVPVGKPITDPLSFVMGYQLGQRLRMRGKKQIPAYLYNGIKLPPLPDYDTEAYPYACITAISSTKYQLWLSSEKLHLTGETGGVLTSVPCYRYATYTKEYIWDDWGVLESGYEGSFAPLWSNYDVLRNDGTLFLSASEPVKSCWDYVIVMLYDGEATTADNGNGIYLSDSLTSETALALSSSNAYRVTIDGVTEVLDVVGSASSNVLGNQYLYNNENYEDNGGSWCIRYAYSISSKSYYYLLYTREPRTCSLKIESVRG